MNNDNDSEWDNSEDVEDETKEFDLQQLIQKKLQISLKKSDAQDTDQSFNLNTLEDASNGLETSRGRRKYQKTVRVIDNEDVAERCHVWI
ncbi:3632_t:CDS:2 [Rhizophagus irregularis]|nr:3632_t:CDS:2 [Rhizophagus irregularis]